MIGYKPSHEGLRPKVNKIRSKIMHKKLLTPISILILLLAGCGSLTAPQTPPSAQEMLPTLKLEPTSEVSLDQPQAFEVAPCPLKLPPGAVEGEHIQCGYLDVPELRFGETAGSDTTTVRLAVAVVSSVAEDPVPDPLVMLVGGPGQSALETFIPLLAAPGMEGFRANREIVLVEQRGTLHSTPFLQCQEMTQFKLDILSKVLSKGEEDALRLEALAACRDRFIESGVNLAAYNSLENAADIIAVVDALGYDQINLYGGSYGSLLAQHILRDYPDRVRSVILDAASPLRHAPNMFYKARSTDAALRRLFAQCEADSQCSQAYPNLETVYFELVDRLNLTPATLQITNNNTGESYDMLLTGNRLITATRDLLYLTPILPDLPMAIYSMAEGDFSLVETIQSLTLSRMNLADGMYHSIVCTELADVTPADFADSSSLYPQVAREIEDLINDVMLQPCQVWNVELLDERFKQSVTGSTPTLLTSGEFDPTVPTEVAQVAAENLTQVYAYTFPGVGHGVLGANACAVSIMQDFLHDPNREPDTGCLESPPGLAFRYPAGDTGLEAFTSEELGLKGLVPTGWTEVQPGVYTRASSAVDPTALQMVLDPQTSVQDILVDISNSYGLSEPPKPTGKHEANGLIWSFYAFEVQDYPRDLALAESESGSLILVIGSSPDEYEVIYTNIFMPMVDALIPLEAKLDPQENTDRDESAFDPFTDSAMGIQGIKPVGWKKAGPGTFTRSETSEDITVLLMQAAPVSAQELLTTLADQLGLSSLPESTSERQANGLDWKLYEIEIEEVNRDIALAEKDGKACIVILRSDTAARPNLYNTVFLPVVDTLTWIE